MTWTTVCESVGFTVDLISRPLPDEYRESAYTDKMFLCGARSAQALHDCGAHRIGHGCRLREDGDLLYYVVAGDRSRVAE